AHQEINIADTSHFILIASTLLLIKSKSLLPTLDLTKEEEESVEDLERRLKLYEKIKNISKLLGANFGHQIMFEKTYRPNSITIFAPHQSLTPASLSTTLRNLLLSIP